jgi:hypothetical protein
MTNTKVFLRIIQVTSLEQFHQEVAVPNLIRLDLTETWAGSRGGLPEKVVSLDLMGSNFQGEIVWLHDSHRVWWAQDGPAFGRDKSIYAAMKPYYALVKAHLVEMGYTIRGGRYGIPDNIKPLRGYFECVKWVKEDEMFKVEVV